MERDRHNVNQRQRTARIFHSRNRDVRDGISIELESGRRVCVANLRRKAPKRRSLFARSEIDDPRLSLVRKCSDLIEDERERLRSGRRRREYRRELACARGIGKSEKGERYVQLFRRFISGAQAGRAQCFDDARAGRAAAVVGLDAGKEAALSFSRLRPRRGTGCSGARYRSS